MNDWKKATPSKWNNVPDGDSSHLERFGYNSRKSTLIVRFRGSKQEYAYYPVNAHDYSVLKDEIGKATVGKTFQTLIKNKYTNGSDGLQYSVREK